MAYTMLHNGYLNSTVIIKQTQIMRFPKSLLFTHQLIGVNGFGFTRFTRKLDHYGTRSAIFRFLLLGDKIPN